MKKSNRTPPVKDNEIKVYYGTAFGERQEDPDICIHWGKDCDKATACLMQYIVLYQPINNGVGGFFPTREDLATRKTLREELEERGYDISTLKISIKKKQP